MIESDSNVECRSDCDVRRVPRRPPKCGRLTQCWLRQDKDGEPGWHCQWAKIMIAASYSKYLACTGRDTVTEAGALRVP